MPPTRTHALSRRNVKRGKRCYGKGYRRDGELYMQVKRNWAGFSRQLSINENETISRLIHLISCDLSNEDVRLPRNLHLEFFARRQRLEPSDAMVKSILDGGEMVYAKVYDDEGTEWIKDGGWEPKVRGRRALEVEDYD